jgi:hypothetical protein
VGVQRIVGRASAGKKWLLHGSMLQKRLFKKMFNTSVQIMIAMMIMLNYLSLFSYPHDNHFKGEEILPFPQHYLNLSVILYHTYSDDNYILQPF